LAISLGFPIIVHILLFVHIEFPAVPLPAKIDADEWVVEKNIPLIAGCKSRGVE